MIIDWISFSVNLANDEHWIDYSKTDDPRALLARVLKERAHMVSTLLFDGRQLTNTKPRAPYNVAISTRYVAVFAHPALKHLLVEINGQGCQELRRAGAMEFTIAHIADRVTRLDVAVDVPGVEPDDIVNAGVSARFRARTRTTSDTGTTIYVGSRKSERFARVYAYNEPHDRAGETRVEAVFRKDYAKALAGEIVENGLQKACKSAMAVFEWEHPDVAQNAVEKLLGRSIDKQASKTEMWLKRQAAPAFKKLVRQGVIVDPVEWLERNMLTFND